MSDRKLEQASERALRRLQTETTRTDCGLTYTLTELVASHRRQIELLTKRPPRTRNGRDRIIKQFCVAARASDIANNLLSLFGSVAHVVWHTPDNPLSLFADMPGCQCPVYEKTNNGLHEPLIPVIEEVACYWRPTRNVLEAFSRVQVAARFP